MDGRRVEVRERREREKIKGKEVQRVKKRS